MQLVRLMPRLGYRNVAKVAVHRLKTRSGWYERRLPVQHPPEAPDHAPPMFRPPDESSPGERLSTKVEDEATDILEGRIRLFGRGPFAVGSPPDWFSNPLTGESVRNPRRHWSRIGDFNSGGGDIKGIWELSRFSWAVTLARSFRRTRAARYLDLLNEWAADWMLANPPNRGPNWKCGQETALRMLHVLSAARELGQHQRPTPTLTRFVAEHCRRIVPTLDYAIAQENNHGTSEAAGLYIGGAWLATVGGGSDAALERQGREWERRGRRHLIERVLRLVAHDGSFSQYSVNYHRMVVDTLAQVELWRRELARSAFPDPYLDRCRKAVAWLHAFTDPISGDAPNVGPNDGTHLFRGEAEPFRDFRPSVERARSAFDLGTAVAPDMAGAEGSGTFPAGGYVRLKAPGAGSGSWAMVRFPSYRFRPSDSDPLHVDLWYAGENVLRDGGSFSYNSEEPSLRERLSGPAGHNTIQFDDRDPMPRVGRFMRGHWLESSYVGSVEREGDRVAWTGRYEDHHGAVHERTVAAHGGVWRVKDRIRGFRQRAVLRWRLAPGTWRLTESLLLIGSIGTLSLEASVSFTRVELTQGWESRRYGEKTPLPVLEAEVAPHDSWIWISSRIDLSG